jgi:hypothetical protein
MALFVPSSQLLSAAGDSKTAQKFVLASSGWIDLQSRLQSILALPSDYSDYQLRYGSASSGLQMQECFDAMNRLQGVAARYGNPKDLRAKILKDPNFLANAERPKNDVYSATVWTLERGRQDAFRLSSTLRAIPSAAAGRPAPEVVTGIKSLFLDTDQIADRMHQTVLQLDALINEFTAISRELAEAQAAMQTFTAASSKTQTALNDEIGGLRSKIAQLEKERDEAYSRWLGLTISACIVPAVIGIVGVAVMVALAVPTGGGSFAVGSAVTTAAAGLAAAGLGTAAGLARSTYDNLVSQVSETNEFMQKRVTYRHDLGALDAVMKFSLPDCDDIISQVTVVRNAWNSSLQEIKYRVGELDVNNLAGGPWLQDAEMAASAANWVKVDEAMRAFVGGSFIDANLIPFAGALPQDDPDWQNKLFPKLAA